MRPMYRTVLFFAALVLTCIFWIRGLINEESITPFGAAIGVMVFIIVVETAKYDNEL